MRDTASWLGHPSIIIGSAWVLLFIAERAIPLRARRSALAHRLWVNACVSALALVTAYLVVMPVATAALRRVALQPVGVLQWAGLPQAAQIAGGLALLDLSFFYWHMANHRLRWLWRFHNVHHIDPDLDVSSAFRFHFGEVALSALLRVAQIIVIGITPLTFAIYEIAFQLNTLFQHSNIRLPLAFERWLNVLIVTPRMHGIHHSDVRRENQSNFSTVLSLWDRLHRTLRLNIAQSRIAIGIPAYFDAANNTVTATVALPFQPQREYWRRADGTIAERAACDVGEPLARMQA